MALKPGRYNDIADSMAGAMEEAMDKQWREIHGSGLPSRGREDRHLLLSSIAQGVIAYLRDNASDAFRFQVEVIQKHGNQIDSKGTVTGTNNVDVTQQSGSGNRVESEGEPRLTEILVDDVLDIGGGGS